MLYLQIPLYRKKIVRSLKKWKTGTINWKMVKANNNALEKTVIDNSVGGSHKTTLQTDTEQDKNHIFCSKNQK